MLVYLIRNLVNDKCYVGQTTEKYEGQRKRQHFHRLKRGDHQNPYLQAAYNKYGAKNFQFELLEVVNSLIELNRLEKTWIEFYRSQNRSYNLRLGGDNNLVSSETKQRMKIAQNIPKLLELRSKVHKGRLWDINHRNKAISAMKRIKAVIVLKFNINDELIAEFSSIDLAMKDWGKSRSGLESHLYKGSKSKEFYYRLKTK